MRFARVLLLLVAGKALYGQSTWAELHLHVTDPSGAPLPASVTLTSQAVGYRKAISLAPSGDYTFRALPPGHYQLLVSRPGFASQTDMVELHSGLPVSREVKLALQELQSRVDVTENQTLLDVDRTGSSNYISSAELRDRSSASSPGRGLIDLIASQPGWTLEANGILHPRESEYDTQFVVNGIPQYENRSPAFAPTVDAEGIESVKLITGGIPAEFGQRLGGVVEVNTTRNTSPGFHGSSVLQGGSFNTLGGFVFGQYTAGRSTYSATGQGFLTDRYLDPPTTANNGNHASNSSFTGSFERDLSETDHLRVWGSRRETRFQVPNDFLQQFARQRQDRTSSDVDGAVSYQHTFSPSLLGALRGSVRNINGQLWSNPDSLPIAAAQERNYREGYVNGTLSGANGIHNWKAGAEARWAKLRETFGYNINSYELDPGNVQVFDPETPASFAFLDQASDREQSAYVQDTMHLRSFTVNAGIRFDHYSLLVDKTGWSPRLSIAWSHQPWGLVLHASYDRTFGTPPFENLLLSASPRVRLDESLYLPIEPSRGNYYEAGFSKSLGSHVRLDGTWFYRRVSNFLDDDVLLNTGISFPITYNRGIVHGIEMKLSVPRWNRWSGFLSYSNSTGSAQFPIAGGLFLEADEAALLNAHGSFPISQDIRNVARGLVRYQIAPRLWTAWSASYNSGLPIEGDLEDDDFLIAEYGANILDRVNVSRGRVRPSFSLNASVGADLWRQELRSISVQGDLMNITDHLNVINFAGLLSGTAVAQPRSAGLRLRFDF